MVSPDTSPNILSTPAFTVSELDEFVSHREKYKQTDDPIRTLQFAFTDEAGEVISAIPNTPDESYDRDNLSEEIGDSIIMGVLIARNQHIPVADLIPTSTIREFQANNDEVTFNVNDLTAAIMDVYVNIDQQSHRTGKEPTTTKALSDYFTQIARLASAYEIDLEQSLRQTITKLEQRSRQNHAVKAAASPEAPQTHAGRYLLKVGALTLSDVLKYEDNRASQPVQK